MAIIIERLICAFTAVYLRVYRLITKYIVYHNRLNVSHNSVTNNRCFLLQTMRTRSVYFTPIPIIIYNNRHIAELYPIGCWTFNVNIFGI